jgi:hypothetical protein
MAPNATHHSPGRMGRIYHWLFPSRRRVAAELAIGIVALAASSTAGASVHRRGSASPAGAVGAAQIAGGYLAVMAAAIRWPSGRLSAAPGAHRAQYSRHSWSQKP